MKILFVQNRLCARAWKEAKVLSREGCEISLAELKNQHPLKDYSIFNQHYNIPVKPDIKNMLKGRGKIVKELKRIVDTGNYDLIHSHNEPDNLGVWAKKNLDMPVVHDIHDLLSLKNIPWARGPKKWVVRLLWNGWEKRVCKRADGILCPSEPMMRHIKKKYSPKRIAYVENKPPRTAFTPKEKIEDGRLHTVYIGGISMEPESPRYLWDIFRKICGTGVIIHLYAPVFEKEKQRPVRQRCEEIEGLQFHPPVLQHKVIREISQYHFGLVVFNRHTKNIKMATSNRMYECQIAGLPVITNDRGHIARYVKRKGCGEVIKKPEEIKEVIEKDKKYNLDPSDYFMEPEPILDLYRSILENRNG